MRVVGRRSAIASWAGAALAAWLLSGCGGSENAATIGVPPSANLPSAAAPSGDGMSAFQQAQANLASQAAAVTPPNSPSRSLRRAHPFRRMELSSSLQQAATNLAIR